MPPGPSLLVTPDEDEDDRLVSQMKANWTRRARATSTVFASASRCEIATVFGGEKRLGFVKRNAACGDARRRVDTAGLCGLVRAADMC
jgi:hypothetical protein